MGAVNLRGRDLGSCSYCLGLSEGSLFFACLTMTHRKFLSRPQIKGGVSARAKLRTDSPNLFPLTKAAMAHGLTQRPAHGAPVLCIPAHKHKVIDAVNKPNTSALFKVSRLKRHILLVYCLHKVKKICI